MHAAREGGAGGEGVCSILLPAVQREGPGERGAAALHAIGSKGGTGKEGRCNIMPAVQRGLGEGGGSCITHAGLRWETGGEGEGGCSMMPPVSKGGAGALSVVFPPATSQGQCMRLAYRYARFVRKFV